MNPAEVLARDLPAPPAGLISPKLKAKAIKALEEGLEATRPVWNKESQAFVMEADYGVRVKCSEIVLAYAEGKPVERQVKLTGDFKDFNKRLEDLLATPEGLRVAELAGLVKAERSQKREKSQEPENK